VLYPTNQLSLLSSAGRGMYTGQSAVMLCGWAVKASWENVREAGVTV